MGLYARRPARPTRSTSASASTRTPRAAPRSCARSRPPSAGCVAEQATKSYVGLLGDLELRAGDGASSSSATRSPADRLSGAQTPGGTGAIRQLLELIRRASPGGDGLALRPDLAEPPGDPRLPRHAGAHLPLLRRRHPRRRLRRHDGRPRGDEAGRRGAAARLLPQPDRRQPRPRPVARGHRLRAAKPASCR